MKEAVEAVPQPQSIPTSSLRAGRGFVSGAVARFRGAAPAKAQLTNKDLQGVA
jgi:hypothetical protein